MFDRATRKRQFNLYLTDDEMKLVREAVRIENLVTAGPWCRKVILDYSEKLVAKKNKVKLDEGETSCADIPTNDQPVNAVTPS